MKTYWVADACAPVPGINFRSRAIIQATFLRTVLQSISGSHLGKTIVATQFPTMFTTGFAHQGSPSHW
jgi:hypothetical protein